jgi:hypothetical protein
MTPRAGVPPVSYRLGRHFSPSSASRQGLLIGVPAHPWKCWSHGLMAAGSSSQNSRNPIFFSEVYLFKFAPPGGGAAGP